MILEDMQKVNTEIGERIDREVTENPLHPYKAKVLGIVCGQVVYVGNTINEVFCHLEKIGADNTKSCIHVVGKVDPEIVYIWELD
jgi:hypothetical protein